MGGTNQQKQTAPATGQNHPAPELSTELAQGPLGLLFERSPDAIFLIDGDALIDCNPAAVEMLRYNSKPALLTASPSDLSSPVQADGRSSPEVAGEMMATAISRGSHRFEWTGRRADDSEFPVEVSLTTIPSENRQMILSVWRDISRRRSVELDRSAAEEALLNQTEILTSILNDMGDAVIVADRNYKFLIFNPAAERMFGTGATETQAESWSRTYGLYTHDEVTPIPAEALPLARAIRGEDVRDVDIFVRHEKAPNGRWTRVSGRPLRNAKGELSGGVIVCRDVTERKKEDAFRTGQGRVLEMIARGKPLAEVLASLVQLIEYQSEGMTCSVLQLSEDGKHIRSGAAPGLPEVYVKAVDGAPIGPKNGSCGTAMYLAKPVVVKDMLDNPLWEDYRELAVLSGQRACWSTPIFSGSGKVLGSFAMYYRQPQTPSGIEARLTDVATHIAGIAIEHQRAEEQLRRTQSELAHVARVTTMGELTASIAHEVNQPLGAIVGNADICLHWLGETQPDLAQLREAIEDIASDGRRASEVIARIRSLVKKNTPEKAPLDPGELAREVLDLVGHEAHRKRVVLGCELEMGLMVQGDRVQLQQVLLNLVMNGLEAMSTLEDRRPALTVRIWKSDDGEVLTTVRDNGPGIKPEDAEQLFKPFHTTKASGMGMGLAISRSIIEAHGGRLWIEPTQAPGAMFQIALPPCDKGGS